MIQRRGHLRLALKSPPSRSIRQRIGEELDRHGAIQFGVERAKHNAHAAVPEGRLQPVRADRCPHGHRQRIALDVIAGRVCVRLGHLYLSSAVNSAQIVGRIPADCQARVSDASSASSALVH